jgi:NAD(P)H-hydrate epimerase
LATAAIPAGAANGLWQQGIPEIMAKTYGGTGQEVLDESAANWLDDLARDKKAIAIGPGMGHDEATAQFLEAYLSQRKNSIPTLLDADALNILALRPHLWQFLSPDTLLTPHPGEMKRLTGRENLNEYRIETAEALAQERQVIVVLKGQGTIIALPNGETWINATGNAGMGTAGAGDVLTGTLAGLLAQGLPPTVAAPLGVMIHGLAGDLAAEQFGMPGVTATRISANLGKALQILQSGQAPQTAQI